MDARAKLWSNKATRKQLEEGCVAEDAESAIRIKPTNDFGL